MKVAICDDEEAIRKYIAECATSFMPQLEINFFTDGSEIAASDFDADILFLDIQMPGIDGMKAAKRLRAEGKRTVIVFVTALEEYVFQAFDVGAFQYIVKPFDKAKLLAVLEKALHQAGEQKQIEEILSRKADADILEKEHTIIIKNGGTNTRVIVSQIAYAEIFDRRIILHMSGKETVEYYGRLKDLEGIVGNDFFRVHRAYLVNLAYVKSYDARTVNIYGEAIPVARGKYQELVKAYLGYHVRKEAF